MTTQYVYGGLFDNTQMSRHSPTAATLRPRGGRILRARSVAGLSSSVPLAGHPAGESLASTPDEDHSGRLTRADGLISK